MFTKILNLPSFLLEMVSYHAARCFALLRKFYS